MAGSKIALFDMDNTLCDYAGAMYRDLAKMASPEEPSINLSDMPEWLEARSDAVKARPGWWLDLNPIGPGMEVLNIALEIGFECHILTKGPWRTTPAWTEKVEWCREHLDGYTFNYRVGVQISGALDG